MSSALINLALISLYISHCHIKFHVCCCPAVCSASHGWEEMEAMEGRLDTVLVRMEESRLRQAWRQASQAKYTRTHLHQTLCIGHDSVKYGSCLA